MSHRTLARYAALLIGAAGLALLAQGLWIPAKAQFAQVLLDRAFERSLVRGKPARPWPWADTVPLARIEVARLDVKEVVLAGGSGEALAFGPTQVNGALGSGVGVGGSGALGSDVRVLAAHRDTHFRFIRDLKQGDEVVLHQVDGTTQRYRVTGFQTTAWNNFAVPLAPPRAMLALATCYPFDSDSPGPLRRIAWAERVG